MRQRYVTLGVGPAGEGGGLDFTDQHHRGDKMSKSQTTSIPKQSDPQQSNPQQSDPQQSNPRRSFIKRLIAAGVGVSATGTLAGRAAGGVRQAS